MILAAFLEIARHRRDSLILCKPLVELQAFAEGMNCFAVGLEHKVVRLRE